MFLFIVAFVLLVCLVAGLLVYARWEHGRLEKMNIPIVKHHPLLGSTRDLYEKVGGLLDCAWREEYGNIFGVYEGRQAQLFVCVPELVRLMCIKDADHFNSKRQLEFGDSIMNEMPDFQKLEKWKLLRSLATPAFTSAKIKMMNLPMREAVQDYIFDIREKIKKSGKGVLEKLAIDVSIHTMLTDLIGRCVFSVKISGRDDDNNEFAKIVHQMLTPENQSALSKELLYWSHTFPFMKYFLKASIFPSEPVQRFQVLFRQMIAERKRSGVKYGDVVDMCCEWMDRLDTPEFKKAQVTVLSVMCQALVFFFAAQDQVSTMVAAIIYHMTQNPGLERQVYAEVDSVFEKHGGKVEHEHLGEFTFLNACISEALRLYAFFHRIERVCTKDWENEEYGLRVPKGMTVQFPIWAMNRCSEYNPEGDKFMPERFLPENKDSLNPYSSTSFGHGPRNCTGKRFATEAMPLIAAYVLKELKFKARKDSKIELMPGGPFFTPHGPIYVDVLERTREAQQKA